MKKILLVLIILFSCASFSQTKKKKNYKKQIVKNIKVETIKEDVPVILDFSSKSDDDATLAMNPYQNDLKVHYEDDNQVYNSAGVEVKPEFPGGYEKFYKFIANEFKMPTDEEFLGGKVIVQFIVEKDGSLSDIKVIKDAGFGTKEEVIRVLKIAPKWNPGKQNGKIVRCNYLFPISLSVANGK